jgi:predicted nucleic acid-binding protein
VHALAQDKEGADCRAFLQQVQAGERAVLLTAMVVHEFTYAVSRYRKEMSRQDIADYLITLMSLPSVYMDDDAVFDAVRSWASTSNLGFVDAYLAIRAQEGRVPVYTKNVRHFKPFDIEVPDPLVSSQ